MRLNIICNIGVNETSFKFGIPILYTISRKDFDDYVKEEQLTVESLIKNYADDEPDESKEFLRLMNAYIREELSETEYLEILDSSSELGYFKEYIKQKYYDKFSMAISDYINSKIENLETIIIE